MAKQRVKDPKTGKFQWIEVSDGHTNSEAPPSSSAPAATSAPGRKRNSSRRPPASSPAAPKASSGDKDWDRLFDDSDDADDE